MVKKSHVILKKRVDYMNIYDDTLDFLISETRDMDRKCFGYLFCDKKGIVSDYYIFKVDHRKSNSKHFETIGNYYYDHEDAGFVADPYEIMEVDSAFNNAGLKKVGVFHIHQRHPNMFTFADWELHPNSDLLHLVISYRNRSYPSYKCYRVNKETKDITKMFNDETVNIVKRENKCETFLNLQIFFQSMLDKVNLYNYLQTVSYSDRRKYWNNYNVSNRAILLHNSNFSFDIKKTLVTNHEYNLFISHCRDDNNYPITNINYYEAFLFADWLGTELLGIDEWEKYQDCHIYENNIFDHDNPLLEKFAYYSQNSNGTLHEVGKRHPNKYGLYDMEGNVWEWTRSSNGNTSFTKGGSIYSFPEMMAKHVFQREKLTSKYYDLGFRVKR